MKKIFFFAIFSLAIISLNAANKVKAEADAKANAEVSVQKNAINGRVIDAVTNETLAGAEISVNGQKIYSDLDGNFDIKDAKGEKIKITISMISYADQVVEIEPGTHNLLNVKLKQKKKKKIHTLYLNRTGFSGAIFFRVCHGFFPDFQKSNDLVIFVLPKKMKY